MKQLELLVGQERSKFLSHQCESVSLKAKEPQSGLSKQSFLIEEPFFIVGSSPFDYSYLLEGSYLPSQLLQSSLELSTFRSLPEILHLVLLGEWKKKDLE